MLHHIANSKDACSMYKVTPMAITTVALWMLCKLDLHVVGIFYDCWCSIFWALLVLIGWSMCMFLHGPYFHVHRLERLVVHLSAQSRLPICLDASMSGTGTPNNSTTSGLYSATKQTQAVIPLTYACSAHWQCRKACKNHSLAPFQSTSFHTRTHRVSKLSCTQLQQVLIGSQGLDKSAAPGPVVSCSICVYA